MPTGQMASASPLALVEDALQHRALLYDKAGDEHYDIISAFTNRCAAPTPTPRSTGSRACSKSGEDPLFVARRLVRFASEDVGLADPQALLVAVAAQQAVHFIGMPEGFFALAEAVVYLAPAPKSNALYTAYARRRQDVQRTAHDPCPCTCATPPRRLMKAARLRPGLPVRPRRLPRPARPRRPDQGRRPRGRKSTFPNNSKAANTTTPGAQGNEASIPAWLARRRSPPKEP